MDQQGEDLRIQLTDLILVGDRQKKVERALLALDCTKEVLRQAKELGAQLIITHHPIIFHPIKRVNEDSLVYHLLRSDIAVISAHTNLDIAQGGVNDLLAKRIAARSSRSEESSPNRRRSLRSSFSHRERIRASFLRSPAKSS